MLKSKAGGFIFQLIAFVLALGFVSLILIAVGASPFDAYKNMLTGSIGSTRKFAEVLVSFVPLLLVTAGLLITFSAGLWNIGVEGQIVLGAIGTTWVLRFNSWIAHCRPRSSLPSLFWEECCSVQSGPHLRAC
jgi:ABC-type uncharacterized transport system permease subunit